jgi:hypothetical protein
VLAALSRLCLLAIARNAKLDCVRCFRHEQETFMAIELRYVFRPLPGASLGEIMEYSKTAAELWKKYQGEVSLWMVGVGEQGNWVFSVKFPDYEAYGKCLSGLTQDSALMDWQNSVMKAGKAEWVRSSMFRQIPL